MTAGTYGAVNIGNGWWRAWFRYTVTSPSSTVKVFPSWGANPSVENTGAGVGSQILVFNVQLEQASLPTSPIETTSSAAVRFEEYHHNIAHAPSVNPSNGTLLLDYHPQGVTGENSTIFTMCSGIEPVLDVHRIPSNVPTVRLHEPTYLPDSVSGIAVEGADFNRVVASIGPSALNMAMRSQASQTSVTRTRSPLTPDVMYLGRDCAGTANVNVGVRRMGYWNVEFHPLILQQMANGNN